MVRTILALLVVACPVFAGEIRLARHPDFNGGRIAFSYAGDIWIANEDGSLPRRVTDHRARDIYPRFSPDGQWIAFSSDRYGNYDVFLVAAAGGAPRRLTYHTGSETTIGWSRDGRHVLFTATRGTGAMPSVSTLFEVPIDGGMEKEIPTGWGSWASYSPDGKKLAFTRHGVAWWRQHYRGSRAADLWVMDLAAKKARKLSDDGMAPNWHWPMYGRRGEIFFVSDRLPSEKSVKPGSPEVLKSVNNIWKISETGGSPVQVTRHTTGHLFFPSMSADGKVIVYEEDGRLWKLDTGNGKSSEIRVSIQTDHKENAVETLSAVNEADSFDLSPSTRRAVISVHGELFTIPTDRGDVSRIAEFQSRETQPVWSPDGKWVAFVSDRSGQDEVWISDLKGANLKQLSNFPREKSTLQWAPDSKSLLYAASDKKLYRANIEDGSTTTMAEGEVGRVSGAGFSPDGRWIAYQKQDRNFRSHVWVVPSAGGEARRITSDDDSFSDGGAVWVRDGKHLIYVGSNQQGGGIAQLRQVSTTLYILPLEKLEKDPVGRDVDDEEAALAAEAQQQRRGPGAGQEARDVEVKIDWDGITRRSRRLAPLSGNIGAVASSPDGRVIAFVISDPSSGGGEEGGPRQAIYTIGIDGQRMTRVTQSQAPSGFGGGVGGGFGGGIRNLAFSKDSRTLYFQEGRGIYAAEVGGAGPGGMAGGAAAGPPAGGRGESRRRLSFTARVEVDHRAVREQVFEESWRIMKHRFYDPGMHGVAWDKVREIYRPLLEHAFDTEEMHNITLQMIGELNASHTGIGGGGFARGGDQNPQTRYPGFELVTDEAGRLRVGHIYKDGPADKEFLKVRTGDYILAIDNTDLKPGENYWKHFTLAAGRKFNFLLNSTPSKEGSWEVRIDSISSAQNGNLAYEKWVADRRAIVEKLSGGEIGYLHIRAMNQPSLRRFERELAENRLKEALVIDQRYNGGGGIEQELLQILQQRPYQYTVSRDSVEVTRPQRAFFGPMVVMQNERSGSNAEMFPHGFRELGLGKVIGVPTLGGVIGTGSYTLMDGSAIRTPGSGVYTRDGINMENWGVPPDVYVDNTPEDFLAGRDAQLERAVQVLKAQMRSSNTGNR